MTATTKRAKTVAVWETASKKELRSLSRKSGIRSGFVIWHRGLQGVVMWAGAFNEIGNRASGVCNDQGILEWRLVNNWSAVVETYDVIVVQCGPVKLQCCSILDADKLVVQSRLDVRELASREHRRVCEIVVFLLDIDGQNACKAQEEIALRLVHVH